MSNKAPRKRRKLKKGFLLLFILIGLLISTLVGVYIYRSSMTFKAGNAYVFDLINGNGVTVLRDGDTKKAYKGMRIIEGDTISTDDVSKVYLKLDDNKNVLLDYSTTITVSLYNNGQLLFNLVKGQFFFDVTSKLKGNETMKFKLANTTVSIRGTSGAGTMNNNDANLMIFTGIGDVDSTNSVSNEKSEFALYPNTEVSFTYDGDKTTSNLLATSVNKDDIPSVMYDYTNTTSDYVNELIDKGWTKEETIVLPPMDLEGDEYKGYRQNADGSWYFSQSDYDNGIGPTPYKDFRPYNLKANDATYNGQIQKADITGFNPVSMKMTNGEQKEAGVYTIIVAPKHSWADGGNESIEVIWTINPKEVIITTDSYRKEYKEKDPKFTSTIEGVIEPDEIKYEIKRVEGEELGLYPIDIVINESDYPNYKITKVLGNLDIYTTFTITPTEKEASYSFPYDSRAHKPDNPVKVSDENGTTIYFSEDNKNWSIEEPTITNAGTKTIYTKAINERYNYEPTCEYYLTVTPTQVEAKTKGYFNNKQIELVAEVNVPPKVSFTAEYSLYEINDYILNGDKATTITNIVAKGTYVAWPSITILDENFIPTVRYTKITVTSMALRLFSHDYYDSLDELVNSYDYE